MFQEKPGIDEQPQRYEEHRAEQGEHGDEQHLGAAEARDVSDDPGDDDESEHQGYHQEYGKQAQGARGLPGEKGARLGEAGEKGGVCGPMMTPARM